MVTTTAGTRKMIVAQVHIRAAANCWSWRGEILKGLGVERYDE